MKAYQVKLKGKNFGVPFVSYDEMMKMLAKLKDYETATTVQMVDIKPGESFREGNTIIRDGIIEGVYYNNHAEHI